MNRLAANLALLVVSLASSLVLVEMGLRIMAPQDVSGSWRTSSPAGLATNKSDGSARHQLGDRAVIYQFHPLHLRDSRLTDDKHTVLVLGDSYTFGWLLQKNDTFIDRLQVLTDLEFGSHAFNFVNAAAGGWGTADYVAYVEEFGKIVGPDIIIVFLNTDDVGRSLKSPLYSMKDKNSLLLDRNRVEPGTLKRLTELIPFYGWLIEELHCLQMLRKAYLTLRSGRTTRGNEDGRSPLDMVPHSGDADARRIGEGVDLAKALFLRLKRWADENGSELYVTTTGWHRPPYEQGPPEPTRAFMALAERFFAEAGIPYHDASHEVLRVRMRAPGSFVIPNDGHPNERGSALIAKSVWPFIMERLHEFCSRRPEQVGAKAARSCASVPACPGSAVAVTDGPAQDHVRKERRKVVARSPAPAGDAARERAAARARPGSGSFGSQGAASSCRARPGTPGADMTDSSRGAAPGSGSFGPTGGASVAREAGLRSAAADARAAPAARSPGCASSAWSAFSVLSARQNSAMAAPR